MTEGPGAQESTARMADGTLLRTLRWSTASEPRAVVLIVHGLGEHGGRYDHVARRLADAGLEVHTYDQRGFGGSAGKRAYVDRFATFHDDLEARLTALRGAREGLPLVLYGHSFGGLVVTGYLLAEPPRPLPDLAILSAPALLATIPAWKRSVATGLGNVLPRLALANEFGPGSLCRDPEVERRYDQDPLVVKKTTTRFASESFGEQARIAAALARGVDLPVPTYTFHGTADPIVPPAASELLVGHGDVTRRVFPDLRHECHNEPEWETVVDAELAWLEPRITGTVARAV
jgi:acylglycerol lipase